MTNNASTRRTLRPVEPVSRQDAPEADSILERELDLPPRTGARPRTGPVAHGQLDQNGPVALQEALWKRMERLAGVSAGRSGISASSTRALHLKAVFALGPPAAFIVGTEFAHLHGGGDGSLHVALPEHLVDLAIRHGWAEMHPIARAGARPPTLVMLYSPRTTDELAVIWCLVQASYGFARGERTNGPPDRQMGALAMEADDEGTPNISTANETSS